MECPNCLVDYSNPNEIEQIKTYGICSNCENEQLEKKEYADDIEYEEDY